MAAPLSDPRVRLGLTEIATKPVLKGMAVSNFFPNRAVRLKEHPGGEFSRKTLWFCLFAVVLGT